ncbi:MAG TPA: hypothetical protein VK171_03960 [Fimbriimonas sp.]|nr:hypothetical protein [Fimbriimonas sp.]
MGWKRINGKDYYYAWREDFFGGREVCIGRGPDVVHVKEHIEGKRKARALDRVTARRLFKFSAEVDRQAKMLAAEVNLLVIKMMRDRGYHYKKSEWRKMQDKSKRNTDGWSPAELRLLEVDKVSTIEHHIRRLALSGLRSAGPNMQPLNDSDLDQIHQEVIDKLIELRAQFRFDESSPIEKLLIEQIMTAWVQWYIASWQVETTATDNDYHKKNIYLEKKYARCQSRLSRTIDQLSKLRTVPRIHLMDSKPVHSHECGI